MSAQDLFTRTVIIPESTTVNDPPVFIGGNRVVRIRPDVWTGGMSFNVGPVYNSVALLQSNTAGVSVMVTPSSGAETILGAVESMALGPWLQLVGATNQTGGANVMLTLDPR